jgi:signal transduction histidine kinase
MSNAIHDLRGPIFAARGYAKLILENRAGDVTVTQQRYLASVLENINKLTAIVTTLQDLPSEDVLNLEQLSFRELLIDVIRDWRERENLARLVESIPLDPMHTVGDPQKLAMAVHKLLGSAVEFTQCGGKIELSARNEDDEITLQIVAVSDASVTPSTDQPAPDLAEARAILRLHGGVASIDHSADQPYHVTCRLPVIH